MNSTKILFLNMLKSDIKRYISERNNTNMLTGQTISQSEIENFPSYKLMNADEKSLVSQILNSLKKPTEGIQEGKVLLKQIPGLVPVQNEVVDFKDAA